MWSQDLAGGNLGLLHDLDLIVKGSWLLEVDIVVVVQGDLDVVVVIDSNSTLDWATSLPRSVQHILHPLAEADIVHYQENVPAL